MTTEPSPEVYVVTNGNACWLHLGEVFCAPLDASGAVQWEDAGPVEHRAFHDQQSYDDLANAIRLAGQVRVG